jgi:NAD-dependent deacetylase
MFDSIKDQIKNYKKIVFVTGAGISQESGIPTFRGKGGLW